jgi:hypothetical protein
MRPAELSLVAKFYVFENEVALISSTDTAATCLDDDDISVYFGIAGAGVGPDLRGPRCEVAALVPLQNQLVTEHLVGLMGDFVLTRAGADPGAKLGVPDLLRTLGLADWRTLAFAFPDA